MKNAAYVNLARWFEYLNDDCDYEKWSQYLIEKLKGFPLQNGLDIGCGGGWFTRRFQREGYAMTGLDCSREMLDKAQETAMKEGVRSEYLLGDVARLKLPRRFSFAIAVNDLVNYLPKEKLLPAFKNVCGALQKGGVFLFDISSKRKFQEKIANTVSVDDREEVTYFNFSSVQGEKAVMDVTLFAKGADGKYTRYDERHEQYIYEKEEIVSALEKSGFTLLQAEGHLGENEETADRLTFLAVRS